jgi:hypothetical protein
VVVACFEIVELMSGMLAPNLGPKFLGSRNRAGSNFKMFLCFVLIDVEGFRVPTGVFVPQVEDH